MSSIQELSPIKTVEDMLQAVEDVIDENPALSQMLYKEAEKPFRFPRDYWWYCIMFS